VSVCRADSEETTPLIVLMLIDVIVRLLFYFSSVKSTMVVAILGCILLQL
jgi:hypothetical protein